VKAQYKHVKTEGTDELSFEEGNVMFVVADVDATYWKGVWQGVAGLIPKEKVVNADVIKEEVKKELAGLRGLAIKTFINTDPHSIHFKIGDIVFVPKPTPDADGKCIGEFIWEPLFSILSS
jgi:hypothetical protein